MATLTNAQLKKAFQEKIAKIDRLYDDFKSEMARLKAERKKIIDGLSKNKDDERIKEILRSIK